MPELPTVSTQAVVDISMRLAESWIKEDVERRARREMPGDYEPAAAVLSEYLRGAIRTTARVYMEAYGEAVREACARVCEAEAEYTRGEFGQGWSAGAKACANVIRENPTNGKPFG